MDMKERRDRQLAYIADAAVMEEMAGCRRILQRLNNVWLGGNTVVCPGVHIGSKTVIGTLTSNRTSFLL